MGVKRQQLGEAKLPRSPLAASLWLCPPPLGIKASEVTRIPPRARIQGFEGGAWHLPGVRTLGPLRGLWIARLPPTAPGSRGQSPPSKTHFETGSFPVLLPLQWVRPTPTLT